MLKKWSNTLFRLYTKITATQIFALSFTGLIVLGTVGLRFGKIFYEGEGLSWTDAFFTATSAVCVTGLIVVDTATYFTGLGQAFILLLIQLGGLGIITFTNLLLLTFFRQGMERSDLLIEQAHTMFPMVDVKKLAKRTLFFTFFLEGMGALILFFAWAGHIPDPLQRAWHAVFHSISAFCNAGFSTFSNSLMGAGHHQAVVLIVMVLVVSGGLGFIVLDEVYRKIRSRGRGEVQPPFSVHSRLTLIMTGFLLLGGCGLYYVLEGSHGLLAFEGGNKVLQSLFMAVTARTAGFNTVDYAANYDVTNFFTILLMYVGGGSGSTAGGLKVTTIGLVALLAIRRIGGYEDIHMGYRRIPKESVFQAISLIVFSFSILILSVFLLTFFERSVMESWPQSNRFLSILFEVCSAFNTVGLSMGITSLLSDHGKWVIISLMWLGRIGLLTAFYAIAVPRRNAGDVLHYAKQDVMIG